VYLPMAQLERCVRLTPFRSCGSHFLEDIDSENGSDSENREIVGDIYAYFLLMMVVIVKPKILMKVT